MSRHLDGFRPQFDSGHLSDIAYDMSALALHEITMRSFARNVTPDVNIIRTGRIRGSHGILGSHLCMRVLELYECGAFENIKA